MKRLKQLSLVAQYSERTSGWFLVRGLWVRGLMTIKGGCEFRDWGSIPSVCQITDADLGEVG